MTGERLLQELLHIEKRRATLNHASFDIADAMTAIREWDRLMHPPVALKVALAPGGACLGCDGTCCA